MGSCWNEYSAFLSSCSQPEEDGQVSEQKKGIKGYQGQDLSCQNTLLFVNTVLYTPLSVIYVLTEHIALLL